MANAFVEQHSLHGCYFMMLVLFFKDHRQFLPEATRGSAMAEGPRDALVSRNSATTKHPI